MQNITYMKLNLQRLALFIWTTGLCLASIQAIAQNPRCSEIFESEKSLFSQDITPLINTSANESKGNNILQNLRKPTPQNHDIILLLGAIINHARFYNHYTSAFFAKGGPFRMGYTQKEIQLIFRSILKQPEVIQHSSLLRLWIEINAGGRELVQYYSDHKLENKIFRIMNLEGLADQVQYLRFDPGSGYILIRTLGTGKTEWISGASFFERMYHDQREVIGINPEALPESEWFKVYMKQKVGIRGSIYSAILRKDTPQEPQTPVKLGQIEEWETRNYTNGFNPNSRVPVASTIIKKLPEFARMFRFRVLKRGADTIVQYPDALLVNEILDSLPEGISSPVRLISTGEFDVVPLKAFAKSWAHDGKLYVGEQGTGHFHDSFLHLIAYLSLPREIALANRSHIDFWIKITENESLKKNLILQKYAQSQIEMWVQNFDNTTGRLMDDIEHSKTPHEIESSEYFRNRYGNDPSAISIEAIFGKYLSRMNSPDPKLELEWRFKSQGSLGIPRDFMSPDELEVIRAIPLMSLPVSSDEIPALVHQMKLQLFLP